MALTEPLTILNDFPGWSTSFELMARQEQSRHASGRTRTKDFGSPIWRGTWVSRSMRPNELDHWRAILSYAMVSQKTFLGWPSSRCRPIAHPGSGALPVGELVDIGADNMSVQVDGLAGITLSVGDMIQIGDDLHRVLEPASGPLTGLFAIEPHLLPGVAVGATVRLNKPSCLMVIDPGSLSASADPSTGRGSISFSAIEARG